MKAYLIGGAPKCGKTMLSRTLAKLKGISYLSVDTLQNIVFYYLTEQDAVKKFPHKEIRNTCNFNDDFYEKYSSREIIDNYIKQGETSEKAVFSIIESYEVEQEDIILEGYQITPKLINDLKKQFPGVQICEIFLIREDESTLVRDVIKSVSGSNWVKNRTKKEATFHKIAKMISEYSRYFEEECEKFNFKRVNMDDKFEEKIDHLSKSL